MLDRQTIIVYCLFRYNDCVNAIILWYSLYCINVQYSNSVYTVCTTQFRPISGRKHFFLKKQKGKGKDANIYNYFVGCLYRFGVKNPIWEENMDLYAVLNFWSFNLSFVFRVLRNWAVVSVKYVWRTGKKNCKKMLCHSLPLMSCKILWIMPWSFLDNIFKKSIQWTGFRKLLHIHILNKMQTFKSTFKPIAALWRHKPSKMDACQGCSVHITHWCFLSLYH